MPGYDAPLAAAVEHRMYGNNAALLENAHLVGGAVHFNGAPAHGIGYAVEITSNRDHAVPADTSLEPQHGLERSCRERLQLGTLFGKMLGYHPLGRGMHAHIGDLIEPFTKLRVEILEIAEAAA